MDSSSADARAHAAAEAWHVLRPEFRCLVAVEKVKQSQRSEIYRLVGAQPDGQAVIAKRCLKHNGRFERFIYRNVLSEIPGAHLDYYGLISESDSDYCWQFMEDAGNIGYRNEAKEHRHALAQRLGLLHADASRLLILRDLPERGSKAYFEHLCSGQQRIGQFLNTCPVNAGVARFLDRLLINYELLKLRWTDIESICEFAPETFVHGDVSGRNIRLRTTKRMPDPLLFDWEWAGRGPAAVDLWLMEPDDAGVYQDTVKKDWPNLKLGDIEVLIRVGLIFRAVSVLNWKSQELGKHPMDRPLSAMKFFDERLTQALSKFGWIG